MRTHATALEFRRDILNPLDGLSHYVENQDRRKEISDLDPLVSSTETPIPFEPQISSPCQGSIRDAIQRAYSSMHLDVTLTCTRCSRLSFFRLLNSEDPGPASELLDPSRRFKRKVGRRLA